jgi:U5 small nuclear ribonucleoprotein component
MASFEDYDEFGNYIGADLDSDDEEEEELPQNQFLQQQPQGAHLEGYDDDESMQGPGVEEGALMEIDGSWLVTAQAFLSCLTVIFLLLMNRTLT